MNPFTWRSPKFFEEPGLFFVWKGKAICIIPFPKSRT